MSVGRNVRHSYLLVDKMASPSKQTTKKRQATLAGFVCSKNDASTSNKKEESETSQTDSKKRKRNFVAHWPNEFPGLEDTTDGMVCTICKQYASKNVQSSAFLSGSKSYRLKSIKGHWMSEMHLS